VFKRKNLSGIPLPHKSRSHAQKKYFSLMLVPSYSQGKTRSLRISHITLYAVAFALLATICTTTIFYIQSRLAEEAARYVYESLEQAQIEYENLQETTAQ